MMIFLKSPKSSEFA